MHTQATAASRSPGLPVQLIRFVGREQEIAGIRQLLGETRLLTPTGAGGSGKTRLALEAAAAGAHAHPDGAVWVELAALTDPALMPQQITESLGIREDTGRSATEVLLEVLRTRSVLLVLDNCEHLADACALLTETLLCGIPRLTIRPLLRGARAGGGAPYARPRELLIYLLRAADADRVARGGRG